jgi:acetate kinase
MIERVLVVNAGSSSLKLSVLDKVDNIVISETISSPDGKVDDETLKEVIDGAGPIDAVGHRVVHGGTEFTEPVLIDDDVVRALEALTDLAPLHQPKSLAGIRAVQKVLPDVAGVACFDTAFHAHLPAAASTYALPLEWRQRWSLRRFGFHGLSHAYASRRAEEMVRAGTTAASGPAAAPPASGAAGVSTTGGAPGPAPAGERRIVTCHLGAGASLAAVRDGASVDTTMGFTPLEGLVMATRSGSVDPGLLLWLQQHGGLAPDELADTLEHGSGLLGLAGTDDMRQVLQAEAAGDGNAALAMGVYLHRLRACVAAMAAALGGVDILVFTGGVGEKSAPVRGRAAMGLEFLGVVVDGPANDSATGDSELTGAGANVRTFVIEAREDKEIARGVRQVLGGPRA